MLFIFDMGGVVTTTAGVSLYRKIADQLGITLEDFLKFSGDKTSSDYLLLLEKGIINTKDFWTIFSERSGIKISCDWFRLLFHPVLNEKTVEIIRTLKKNSHRVVCGTNTFESHYDNHMARGDYSYFDTTYASIHMGLSKPDPEFWKLILKCEGYKPEDAFFTDDKELNCIGAQKLGIKTYRFISADGLEQFLKDNNLLKSI